MPAGDRSPAAIVIGWRPEPFESLTVRPLSDTVSGRPLAKSFPDVLSWMKQSVAECQDQDRSEPLIILRDDCPRP
ncbi:hypothetical protein BN2476_1130013 [Paraburkholderia piptadeniae]|uniref:Uncharacterized protein n=1 Tax=Paraburkholderia piptadeniae TaxID=1701573 RepID=A0A1N7SUW1_9BURK|nr:hypothetical protein BN2476_1130013 [Paraburkholderia piptadeniae]